MSEGQTGGLSRRCARLRIQPKEPRQKRPPPESRAGIRARASSGGGSPSRGPGPDSESSVRRAEMRRPGSRKAAAPGALKRFPKVRCQSAAGASPRPPCAPADTVRRHCDPRAAWHRKRRASQALLATPLAGPHWHTWHEPCRRHPDAAVTWAGTLAGSQPAHFRTVSGRRPVVTAGHAGGSPGSGLPLCGPDFRWAKSGWKCVAGEEMGHVVCRNEGVRLCSSSYVLDRWFGDIPGQQREKYFVNSL